MPFARKTFLSGTLLAAAAALNSCTGSRQASSETGKAGFFRVLSEKDYDYDAMMAALRNPNPHKQVFLTSSVPGQSEGIFHLLRVIAKEDVSALFVHMQLAKNAYDFSIGPSRGTLTTLGVLTGSAVILGLDDSMWRKYSLGQHFNLARTNVTYKAKSNLDPNVSPNDPKGLYQDWSAQAVLKRGGSFMVCHNALTDLARTVAGKTSGQGDAVLDDMVRNLLPGFMLVPAGVMAVQLAQEYGWNLYIS